MNRNRPSPSGRIKSPFGRLFSLAERLSKTPHQRKPSPRRSRDGADADCARVRGCQQRRCPCPGNDGLLRAQTLMGTFKTFAMYAGAVICLGGLIFAGIRMMSGRFQDAIPGLFGALFGAGVLGWGAGWIGSLTGQSM